MQKPLIAGLAVQYTDAAGRSRAAEITEVLSPTTAYVAIGENATALASYAEEKAPNTFCFKAEEPAPAKPKPETSKA